MRNLHAIGVGAFVLGILGLILLGPGTFGLLLLVLVICTFGLGLIPLVLVCWAAGLLVLSFFPPGTQQGSTPGHVAPTAGEQVYLVHFIRRARSRAPSDVSTASTDLAFACSAAARPKPPE